MKQIFLAMIFLFFVLAMNVLYSNAVVASGTFRSQTHIHTLNAVLEGSN